MNENRQLLNMLSKDIGLSTPVNKYFDNDRTLNYDVYNDELNLTASFKKYDDRVYNVWYKNDGFRFYGMKDLTIYDIYINNDSFFINKMKDENGDACIKKIKYFDNNKKLLSVENSYIDNPNNNEYISIENVDNKLSLIINDECNTVSTTNKKVKSVIKSLLELEESDIEESFNLINSSIPNFFDKIKYNFKVLENFNKLYDNNQLYTENIMDDLIHRKTKTK